ncbi:Hypothetical predicted protein [Xyrichtys novacula]|uniref:Uncharacterized protein n=1 Tax=Xyrichtys novacula TaxID=13765 RepID=A0AAV1GQ90_XYRNO|nr:Hypothetical predicted protein [Xyrichtys novacula]
MAYCPLAQRHCTVNFWLLRKKREPAARCTLHNWPGALMDGPSDSSHPGKYVSFSGSIWCKQCNSKLATFSIAIQERERARESKKERLLVKIKKAVWSLRISVHKQTQLIVLYYSSYAIVSLLAGKSEQAPSLRFIAPYSLECRDTGCQPLKGESDCLKRLLSINQTRSLVSLSFFVTFWCLSLSRLHSCSYAH